MSRFYLSVKDISCELRKLLLSKGTQQLVSVLREHASCLALALQLRLAGCLPAPNQQTKKHQRLAQPAPHMAY
jgi:hypothetical protein